jgi:hypothetical protein
MKTYCNKICLIFILLYAQNFIAQGQTPAADKLKNNLLDSICHCFSKTDFSSIKTAPDASRSFSACIAQNMNLVGEYANAIGVSWEKITKQQLQELTKLITSEAYKNCPAVQTVFNRVNTQANTTKTLVLKNKLTDSICLCISKTDNSTINNLNDAQVMLTRCLAESTTLMDEYSKSAAIDLSKESNSQNLANDIAAEVFRKCASMKAMISRVQKREQ